MVLTQLPAEILHNILGFVDPKDLAAVSRTCHDLHSFVVGNEALCRDIYYRILDDPGTNKLEWEKELHDLVRLQVICSRRDVDKKSELPFVYETVTRLLKRSSGEDAGERSMRSVTYPESRNASILAELFNDEGNREAFLSRSFLFERARGETTNFQEPPRVEHQQSAKLHCLYGMPQLKHGRTRSSRMYPFACSKVYDLREYTGKTRWGPFMGDGSLRVDWERVEAILLVLRSNIKNKSLDSFPIFANFWNTPFAGSWSGSYLPWPARRELSALDQQDPYDISGTWLRIVCFLDYNDFFIFNFPPSDELPANVPRQTLDIGDATRLILMKITVTKIEAPGPEDGQDLPVVHFHGFSRSLDGSWDENANSDLRGEINIYGSVRLTPEGEVRWTSFSIFQGMERWRSEGIQVGGVRSARGVVGNWFDKDFDPHGPCGPTAFWKISDREPETDDKQVLLHDFLPIVDGYDEEYGDEFSDDAEAYMPEDLEIIPIHRDEDD